MTKLLSRSFKAGKASGKLRAALTQADLQLLLAMVFASLLVDPTAKNPRARGALALGIVLDGVPVR